MTNASRAPSVLTRTVVVILDIIELYVPAVAFLVLFVVFNLQIFYRYVLNDPLSWTMEVQLLAFVWTALLGASYMRRKNGHIVFDLVFEMFGPRGKALAILVGNLLIAIACLGSLPSTLGYFDYLTTEQTPILRIPFSIGFSPLLVFLVLVGVYSLVDIFRALKSLFVPGLAGGAK